MNDKIRNDTILNILSLEDSVRDFEIIREKLIDAGFNLNISRVEKESDFVSSLRSNKYDIIIADFKLPGFDAMMALRLYSEICPEVPFICVSGTIGEEKAIELLKQGASDFVMKDRLERLPFVIKRALDEAKGKTIQRQAEEALRESEAKYHLLINTADESIIVAQDGLLRFVNPKTLELLKGYSGQELIDKPFSEFIHHEDRSMVVENFRRRIANDAVQNRYDFRVVTRDGIIKWVEINVALIEWQGKPATLNFLTDITKRKRSEQLLSESETRYRRLFEAAKDGIIILDAETGKIRDVNPFVIELLGYSQEQFLKKAIWEIGFFKDIFANQDKFKELQQDEYIRYNDLPLKTADGRTINVEFVSNVYLVNHHKVIQCNIRDITERKLAEEALKESEGKFKAIYQNSNDAIMLLNKNGFFDCNQQALELFKINTKEEFVKFHPSELSPPVQPDGKNSFEASEEYSNIAYREGYHRFDWVHRRTDGEYFYADVLLSAYNFGGGRVLQATVRDITDRKLAEEELLYARDRAEESDRLKTAFLHNISHEIRTPMNAIVGFSSLLGEPGTDALSLLSFIEIIKQSSNHLLEIITDIVDIANIEASPLKIVKNGININSTLKSLCDQLLYKASAKKIHLVCETGVSDSDACIITDSTKLTQILTNLINNAIKFTDKGHVKVSCVLRNKFLEYCVSDTGIGIPLEYHQKIFDRFYKVHNTGSQLYEGTGLGLAISKACVEVLGGKIWLSSEPGKGASFFFTIPYEKQVAEILAVKEARVAEGLVFPVKKTILVAEDAGSNFQLVKYFLSGTNSEIIGAVNGKEAVEKCLSNRNIDLVLMDIKMPIMDGYAAVRLIRKANITIPIIAQTAYVEEKERAIESGCSGFISKQFYKNGLLKIIREFI